jgi:TRAP-type C4-dicarboxylate transport system substrate-binding protein
MISLKSKLAASVGAALIAATFSVSGAVAQQAPMVLKLTHGATTDQAIGKGMLKFAELVAQKSGGKVKVETYLAGSLYSERTALEAMVNGSVDFAGASNANWAAFTNASPVHGSALRVQRRGLVPQGARRQGRVRRSRPALREGRLQTS